MYNAARRGDGQSIVKNVRIINVSELDLPCSLGAADLNLTQQIGCEYLHLDFFDIKTYAQFPPRSCLMKTTISLFSTVPELSLSKVAKTSLKASSENSSPPPRLPRVSWTNFLVSSLSSSPDLSTS